MGARISCQIGARPVRVALARATHEDGRVVTVSEAGGRRLTQRKKILLVDDSSTVLLFEKMVLSKEPYELVVARDGQEGLDKAVAERPNLILMDVMMPRMDGVEATRRIRAHGEIARTPVILVTTRGEPEAVATGRAAGCSDYVVKPIDAAELLSKVKALIA